MLPQPPSPTVKEPQPKDFPQPSSGSQQTPDSREGCIHRGGVSGAHGTGRLAMGLCAQESVCGAPLLQLCKRHVCDACEIDMHVR